MDWRSKRFLLSLAGLLLATGVLLIAAPFVVQAVMANTGKPVEPAMLGSNLPTESVPPAREATSSWAATETTAPPSAATEPTPSSPATPPPVATVTPPTQTAAVVAPAGPSLDAYKGLGSWVDIYDDPAWASPRATVADMAKHGVRTLYIETSNSRSSFDLKDPSKMSEFISAAHSHNIQVVAWYLPDMTKASKDYRRIKKAIEFRTSGGEKFDSFALDIESSAVKSESRRNRALASLSTKIRSLVGASYPLGAIIPSPVGLAKKAGYWDSFPYSAVAQRYDVMVPMAYYTYHGKGASAAYADAKANVRILRAQKGCSKLPIHLIGGIAEKSSASEVKAFVKAAVETHCFGASLYSWPGTSASDWRALSAIKP
jgi:hypothetical protein